MRFLFEQFNAHVYFLSHRDKKILPFPTSRAKNSILRDIIYRIVNERQERDIVQNYLQVVHS